MERRLAARGRRAQTIAATAPRRLAADSQPALSCV